ncbi:restriction endonuclease subunit S [Microcoleus sp. F10-C6]|uniref:restriction endonuclease subunit S n=1 Tax=unclassified Microcoleus TaxID=2642155 RepID=UPI002FD488B3
MSSFTTIEDVCDLVTDGTHYTPKNVGLGIPFLTVKDVTDVELDFTNCSFISDADYQIAKLGNSAPQKGDVLFSKDGTVGKVHIVNTDKPFAVLSSLAILRPNKKLIESQYLGNVLRLPLVLDDALKRKTGSAIRRIILADLKRVRFPLPSLEEQRRIAEILDRAEELRSKRREAIAQLDTLTQAIFIEMFGNPVTNAMGWEIQPFGKLVINKDSKRKPVKEENRTKQEKIYPYYGAIGIIDYVDHFLFEGTNLLIEEDGMNLVTRNKPIALIAQGKYWVNNHAHVVCEKEKINLNYLCHYLNYQDISNFVTGIDQKKLNRTNLDQIPVILPPLPLQREFAKRVEAVEKLKAAHRATLSEFDALFYSLQHRAFRGEL